MNSCSIVRETVKFSQNSVSPEVDFEPKLGEIVFCIFLRKEAVSGETNCSPFSFSLGPIFVQNMSEIDFSTCAAESRF